MHSRLDESPLLREEKERCDLFSHPAADIPVDFALAVWAICCNQAYSNQWDLVCQRSREKGLDEVLGEIDRILEENGVGRRDEERTWWENQITKVMKFEEN